MVVAKKKAVKPRVKKAVTRVKKTTKAAKGKIAQEAEIAVKKSKAEFSKVKTKLVSAEKKVRDMIKRNPKAAVAVISALGAAVSVGLSRAFRRSKAKKAAKKNSK